MKRIISCEIDYVTDNGCSCVIISFCKGYAMQFLLLLDALKYNRIGKIECNGTDKRASFSQAQDDGVKICIPGLIQEEMSSTQADLLRCCCIDCALGNYAFPHVDFEFGKVDLTIIFN